MKRTCGNCAFFQLRYKECRRNPPIIHVEKGLEVISYFPNVSSAMWCGEWGDKRVHQFEER